MDKKVNNGLLYFLLAIIVILIVIIGVGGYLIITTNNSINSTVNDYAIGNTDNKPFIAVTPGKYYINEIGTDAGGVSNEDVAVELSSNSEFNLYMGWGTSHVGVYRQISDMLICKSVLLSGEQNSFQTDVVFQFQIVDTNKLKLVNVEINDFTNENVVYSDMFGIGSTFSVKENK